MTPCLKLCANQMKSFYIFSFALFYSAYILFICFHLLFLKGSGREAADYNKKKKSRLTTARGQQRPQKSLVTIKKATRIKLATKTTIDSDRLDWDLNSHRLPTILNRYTLYDYLNHYTTSCSTCTIPRSVDYHIATTSPEKTKLSSRHTMHHLHLRHRHWHYPTLIKPLTCRVGCRNPPQAK